MSTPLPPDPYIALGVSKDAAAALIKSTYRKLVLKCHPDKVTDESKKAEAADQFHRIQQAYEILSDEGRRSRYDAQIKLAEVRKQAMNNRPPVEVKTTATHEMPTTGPGRATYTARGPERVYEERRPERSDSDDYFSGAPRTNSRKYDDYERPAAKKAAPRDDKERARGVERERRESERVSRTDKRRMRDQDTKRERDRKYSGYEEDSDADLRVDAERRRRAVEEAAARDKEMRERERVRVEREPREDRGRERDEYERERERPSRRGYEKATHYYSRLEDDVMAYQGRDKRPSLSRSASTAATKTETYIDRSSSRPTPAFVRRHSTKPTPAAAPPPPRRDRKLSVPDIVESDERRSVPRPATLYPSTSSPSSSKLPRGVERGPPLRTTSMKMDDRDVPPMPMPMRRSETMPNISPRRVKESKAFNLRGTEFPDGLPTPSASPDYAPSPSTYKAYHYPRRDPSTSHEDVDYRRPLDRDYERERRVHHSPEPMRPSKSSATPRYAAAPQPPPIRTNTSYNSGYTTESPTSYTNTRPSPTRHETQRDYNSLPKVSTPKANSSAKYEYPFERIVTDNRDYDKERRRGSPIDVDVGYKKASQPEDVRIPSGYSGHRAPASAPRPRLHRQQTSEYTYSPRPQPV